MRYESFTAPMNGHQWYDTRSVAKPVIDAGVVSSHQWFLPVLADQGKVTPLGGLTYSYLESNLDDEIDY